MITINVNTVENEFYDENGSLFQDGMPAVPFKNTEKLKLQLFTATPNAGTGDIDPDTDWTKDTRYDGITTIGALLSSDNNFTHNFRATLKTALTAGAITQIDLTTSADTEDVPSSGALLLYAADGTNESVNFTAKEAITGGYTFTVDTTITNSYDVGASVDMPEALYAQATLNTEESEPATGLFVFDFTADSPKLRDALDYSDTREASTRGLELFVFKTALDDTVTQVGRWLCTTFSIPNAIADLNQTSTISTEQENQTVAIVNAALGGKVDKDLSNDTTYPPLASVTGTEDVYLDNGLDGKAALSVIKDYMNDGMMELAATPTNGNILTTDADGQAVDSGKVFSTDGTFADDSDFLIPTQKAVKAYADSIVTGLLDYRGNFDASGNVFPSTGGSGTAGAVLQGDTWVVSVGGTLGTKVVKSGDQVSALIDTPGQTASNWNILEGELGYIPENIENKATDFTFINNTKYPTIQAVDT